MYERIIREIKKTFYKTSGRTHLTFAQLESVVMDIERWLNNRPLTYVESGACDDVLMPNSIVWGQDSYVVEDNEMKEDELTRFDRRLKKAKEHAWSRLQNEYVHGLMESHRVNRKEVPPPKIGDIVLIMGEEKNQREMDERKDCSCYERNGRCGSRSYLATQRE